MRIDATNRANTVASRSATGRAGNGPAFIPAGEQGAARVAGAAPVAPMAGLDAILALQNVSDFREGKRRAVKRGTALLDMLEDIKADLLIGQITPARRENLMGELDGMREKVDPALDAIIDDIELRVLVELAKLGRFPRG